MAREAVVSVLRDYVGNGGEVRLCLAAEPVQGSNVLL